MAKYRKVPVVIDAWQWSADPGDAPQWLLDHEVRGSNRALNIGELRRTGPTLQIATLQGVMIAGENDWIIKGVNGELYPCKPDIFAKTYVPATPEPIAIGDDIDLDELETEMQKPGYITAMNDEPTISWRSAPIAEDDPAHPNQRYTRFRDQLQDLINSNSMENGSDTPDFMLAEFLTDALMSFDRLMQRRDGWYGGSHRQLKAQLEAEGAHTAAANDHIDAMQRSMDKSLLDGQ